MKALLISIRETIAEHWKPGSQRAGAARHMVMRRIDEALSSADAQAIIAQRDARIADLLGDNADLSSRIRELEHKMDYYSAQPSAGVVVGALVSALEGIVHDERVPNEVSQDYAALLIEARRLNQPTASAGVVDDRAAFERHWYAQHYTALNSTEAQRHFNAGIRHARLNPGRAQAVPDGYVMVPVNSTEAMRDAIDLLCDDSSAFDDSEAFWRYLLAAAPSAQQKESE